MRSARLTGVLLTLLVAACGGGGSPPPPTATPTPSVTATLTPSPVPTPTVTATAIVAYRLTEGSTILFTPPMPGSAQIAAPLSGTFTVFRSQNTPPNTFIGLTIAHIDFQGGSQFVVTDGNPMPDGRGQEVSLGCILALTVEPNHVYVFALVSINGDSNLGLVGGVWTPPNSPPSDLPTFNNLELCGGPLTGRVMLPRSAVVPFPATF